MIEQLLNELKNQKKKLKKSQIKSVKLLLILMGKFDDKIVQAVKTAQYKKQQFVKRLFGTK